MPRFHVRNSTPHSVALAGYTFRSGFNGEVNVHKSRVAELVANRKLKVKSVEEEQEVEEPANEPVVEKEEDSDEWYTASELNKLNKAELQAIAEENDIDPDQTVAELRSAILELGDD
jgi:hypothetical protein